METNRWESMFILKKGRRQTNARLIELLMTFCPGLLLSRREQPVEDNTEEMNRSSDDEHRRPFFATLKQNDVDVSIRSFAFTPFLVRKPTVTGQMIPANVPNPFERPIRMLA